MVIPSSSAISVYFKSKLTKGCTCSRWSREISCRRGVSGASGGACESACGACGFASGAAGAADVAGVAVVA